MLEQQKNALITGGASGIGLAISTHLAEQGYKVWVSDIQLQAAQVAALQINSHALQLDVTQQDQIDAAVATIQAADGRLDLLINNAGIQHVAAIEDFSADKWRLVNDVLLVGPAMLTRGFLPLMRSHNYGRIINIGSIHALVGSPFKSAYVAAKHGLLGFSKVVALETASQDITINTICPAYVKTPLVDKQIADQAKRHGISEEDVINNIMLEPMPKKSFISVAEICGSVDYLVSDVARNVTAQSMVIDGAWTAR
ncbi:MAG TPA: 3-hydroxybutyrate dehydrogenase [Oceanospirillaceae bacterium]|nr:3-hydroxybutyrate dehydrogenase [Oceanospirillaceae bacterium]